MHHQRIAAFVLGAWIMGSLFMIFVATQNFQMADALGNPDTHAALRQMAGRLNQRFFVNWELVELILAIGFAAAAWFGTGRRVLAGISLAPLAIVAVQRLFITPRMLSLTAQLGNSAVSDDFAKLHAMYGILEVLKLVLLFALAALLLPSWPRRGTVDQISTPRARSASSTSAISSSRVI
jgi:hypothetical protein